LTTATEVFQFNNMGFLQFTLDSEEIQRYYELSKMATGMQLAEEVHKNHLQFLREQRRRLDFAIRGFEAARNLFVNHQEETLDDCQLRWNTMNDMEKETSQDGKVLKALMQTLETDIPKLKNGENDLEMTIKKERQDLDKTITVLERFNHGLDAFKVSS